MFGGGDVSSLTSILLLAVNVSCCRSSPRARVPTGSCGAPDDGAFRRGTGGVDIIDMLLFPLDEPCETKAEPSCFLPHFCLFCLSPFSLCCLSLFLSLSPQARYSVGERGVRLHTAPPAGINPARKRLPIAVVRYSSKAHHHRSFL